MAEYKFKEITLDGEKYVSKKDLLAAIKGMKKDSMEGTKPGYIQEKKGRRLAAFLALNHLGAELTHPEREKYIYENITNPKQIIVSVNMENQETFLYFRGWCKHIADRRENVPIFSEDPNEAVEFSTYETAEKIAEHIKAEYNTMKLAIVPRGRVRIETGLRHLHEKYGWPMGREEADVLEDELYWVKTLG